MKPKSKPTRDKDATLLLIKEKFFRFHIIVFTLFVALIYIYVFIEINNFSNAKPNPLMLSNSTQATKFPVVSDTTIKKINELQDNSVKVKALFNEARNNPFN